MLGQAVGDVGVLRRGEQVPAAVGQLGDMQRAVTDVGDPLPGRIKPRLDDRSCGRDQPRNDARRLLVGGHGQDPELPVQRESHRLGGCVGRVGDDARGQLASPFPPYALSLRHLAAALVPGRSRVGQHLLGPAAAQIQQPQAAHGILAAPGAQEQHPAAVSRDRRRARHAEGEVPGPGELPGELVDVHPAAQSSGQLVRSSPRGSSTTWPGPSVPPKIITG